MSIIQISLTHTQDRGKLIIHESCCLCNKIQKNDEHCIRYEKNRKILCKNCIRNISYLNIVTIINYPDQKELNFG
jgi:hypothetical protein